MKLAEVQRFSRQIALPEVGPEGQARICSARVLVVGEGPAAETTASYLRAAGVGEVSTRAAAPADGGAWVAALDRIDLLVRVGFDDDAMLGAAQRRGLPVVVARATPTQIDLLSFPRRAPAPAARRYEAAVSAARSLPTMATRAAEMRAWPSGPISGSAICRA